MQPDENFKVFDENAEIALNQIGEFLKSVMPPGYGFAFLMTTFGKGGNTFYFSDVQRADMIEMMREFIAGEDAKNGG
jgi:hypothetical protein